LQPASPFDLAVIEREFDGLEKKRREAFDKFGKFLLAAEWHARSLRYTVRCRHGLSVRKNAL
jgi:hypothetical protein